MKHIFYSNRTKMYYHCGENVECRSCGKIIDNLVKLCLFFDEKNSMVQTYCINCKIRSSFAVIQETIIAIITDKPPKECTIRFFKPPSFSVGRISVYQAADARFDKYIGSDTSTYQLNDKTRLAGRESWNGVSIGCSETAKRIEQEDKVLLTKEEEVGAFLNTLKEAKPMIEERQTKRIANEVKENGTN